MRKLSLVLLAMSLVFGGLALLLLKSTSPQPAIAAEPAVRTTTVVTAAKPIALGEALGPNSLKAQPWPEGAAPAGAFRTIDEVMSAGPRYALGPIIAGDVILPRRISGASGRATLSASIRPGMRATAIRVDDVMGVAGFVLPGEFVDVIVTRREGAEQSMMRSDVLIQAVRVLAVDQLANQNKSDPVVARAATIEVTPAQAQKLALAGQAGTLSLALRSGDDPLAEAPNSDNRTIREADLRLDGASPPPARGVTRARLVAHPPSLVSHPHSAGPTMEIIRAVASERVAVKAE